jgi:hypothetical protein
LPGERPKTGFRRSNTQLRHVWSAGSRSFLQSSLPVQPSRSVPFLHGGAVVQTLQGRLRKPRFGAQSLPSARSAQCSKRRVQSGKSIKAFGGNAAGGMVTADQVDLSFVPTFLDAMHNGLRCKQAGVSVHTVTDPMLSDKAIGRRCMSLQSTFLQVRLVISDLPQPGNCCTWAIDTKTRRRRKLA